MKIIFNNRIATFRLAAAYKVVTKAIPLAGLPPDNPMPKEPTMLNLNHDTDPFHPLEIVAFACVGFVLSVMLALLIGQKVFHDDIGFAPAWVEMFTP